MFGNQYAAESLLERELDFFFNQLRLTYKTKLETVEKVLRDVGFTFGSPDGAYYIFACYENIPALGRVVHIHTSGIIRCVLAELDSTQAAQYLIRNVGVAAVPGREVRLGASLASIVPLCHFR